MEIKIHFLENETSTIDFELCHEFLHFVIAFKNVVCLFFNLCWLAYKLLLVQINVLPPAQGDFGIGTGYDYESTLHLTLLTVYVLYYQYDVY